jgi:hypothetical protein
VQELRRLVPSALIWAGSGLLLISVLLPWYGVTGTFPYGSTDSAAFYPGSVHVTSTGFGAQTLAYRSYPMISTGALYTASTGALLGALVIGLAAGALPFRGTAASRTRALAVTLSLGAMVVSLIVPLGIAILQPGTICSDAGSFAVPLDGRYQTCTWEFDLGGGFWASPGGSLGPQTSFIGHADGLSWGPSLGWFLPFVAAGLMATSAVISWRRASETPGPARDVVARAEALSH